MLPNNVVLFERFCYASVVLGFVHIVLDFPGPPPGMALDPAVATFAIAFIVVVAGFFLCINVLLIWLTARRASNVARWIFAVLAILGLVVFVFQVGEISVRNMPAALVSALATMLDAIAVVLIFTGDARDHFA